MKKENRRYFYTGAALLIAFVLWTAAVVFVDVRPVGPQASSVGLAYINSLVHRLTGVNMYLYILTDLLSIVPFAVCTGFGMLGLSQLIRNKRIAAVDKDIISLGIFYTVVIGVYLFFEQFAVNYRPVLIEGVLEASYPSSTTVLVLCTMLTAYIQADIRINDTMVKKQ